MTATRIEATGHPRWVLLSFRRCSASRLPRLETQLICGRKASLLSSRTPSQRVYGDGLISPTPGRVTVGADSFRCFEKCCISVFSRENGRPDAAPRRGEGEESSYQEGLHSRDTSSGSWLRLSHARHLGTLISSPHRRGINYAQSRYEPFGPRFHWGPPRVYEIDMIQISLSDETLSYYFMNEVNLGVVNKGKWAAQTTELLIHLP
jgi:hypothetical protein